MHIPENGRVVVIDDKLEEGIPLTIALSKIKIPTIYYSGQLEELPSKPLVGIRIVFLDIILGTDGQPVKTQVATAVKIFKSIIDKNNGPYLLIAWTKHPEHIDAIKKALADMPPIFLLDMEKSNCKNDDGKYDISKIEKRIITELNKIKSFQVFSIWETLVHQSAGEIVNTFASFYPTGDDWDKQMAAIFLTLAEAYAGKQLEVKLKKEVIKNALQTFNHTFLDCLENKIADYTGYKEIDLSIENKTIESKIIANINSKLLLALGDNTPKPGNLYKISSNANSEFQKSIVYDALDRQKVMELFASEKSLSYTELFDSNRRLQKKYKKDFKSFEDALRQKIKLGATFIELEISPYCDYAQKKWKMQRVLSGIVWPQKFCNLIKRADYIYTTPLLEIEGARNKIGKIIFDLRYLKSFSFKQIIRKKIFLRMKQTLLVDIQSHMGRHMNRPGVAFLE
jgi:hypothetical protein